MTTPPLDLTEGIDPRTPAWVRACMRFFFASRDPTGLGLMRLLAGMLIFWIHLVYSYDLFSYVGPHPWTDQAAQRWIRKEAPVYFPESSWTELPHSYADVKGQYFWSIYYHVHDPVWTVIIHVSILVIFLLFTAGVWTRVTSVLAWMGAIQYVQRLPTSMYGQDTMLIILLTYLMVGNFLMTGNGTAALSVDRWLELRRLRRERAPAADLTLKPSWSANFAIRLVQIHFCIIYITSGSTKLLGPSWWSGTALWSCLANYNFAPMDVHLYNVMLRFFCEHMWLWQLAMTGGVVFTLFTEIGFTFLVWQRGLRPVMVSCSILLHLGIGLGMGLVVFSLLMLVMVLAFVPPESMRAWVDGWADRLRQRFKRKEPPAPHPAPAKEAPVLART
jgi:hypothetical protein